jgi:hypothetical protein
MQQQQQEPTIADLVAAITQLRVDTNNQINENQALRAQLAHQEGLTQQALLAAQQAQEAQQAAVQGQQQAAQPQADPEVRARAAPTFKVPSVKPPTFNGETIKKPAHEAASIINDYLYTSEEVCRLHRFLGDNETPTHVGQPSYTDFIATGLTGQALKAWQHVETNTRRAMTWSNYQTWIRNNFSSPLTFTEANESLRTLKQKGSAQAYTQVFNDLVYSIEASTPSIPGSTSPVASAFNVQVLCSLYRGGLKPILQADADLHKLNTNLTDLQRETERLDDFYWRQGKKSNNNNYSSSRNHQGSNQHHSTYANKSGSGSGPAPMDLSNLQQRRRLTDDEKQLYRRNQWCTYCRSHEHTYEKCDSPGKRKFSPKLNNAESQTKNRATEDNENPSIGSKRKN